MLPPSQPRDDSFNQGSQFSFDRNQTLPYPASNLDSQRRGFTPLGGRSRHAASSSATDSFSWPPDIPFVQQNNQPRHMSLPPSRAESVGQEDILSPEEITNPLGAMSNMAGLVEAAVERAREERSKSVSQSAAMGDKRTDEDLEAESADGQARPAKKTRFESYIPTGPAVLESQNLPPTSARLKAKMKLKKTHIHAYPDAVAEGFVSEEEGRELVQLYVS